MPQLRRITEIVFTDESNQFWFACTKGNVNLKALAQRIEAGTACIQGDVVYYLMPGLPPSEDQEHSEKIK